MIPRLPGARAPVWALAESATSAVLSVASLLVIGRVIGPHEAGVGAVAIAAFLLLDVAGACLFPDALVQLRGLTERHVRSALTAATAVGAGAAALLLAAAPLLAEATGYGPLLSLLPPLALLLPLSAFCGAASGAATREQRFRFLALRVLVGQPIALTAGLVAASAGLGAWALVINQAVATAVVLVLFVSAGRLPLRPCLDRNALGELLPVALPQLTAVALMAGRYRVFLLALGLALPEVAVAHANAGLRMQDAALIVAVTATARVAMPRLCAVQHDKAALAHCYGSVAQLAALAGLPIALGIALVADDLVFALLGPAWASTAEAARVGALATCLACLCGEPFSLFVALGRARWNTLVAAAKLALVLVAVLLLRPETPAGAALAWGGQALVTTPVLAWLVLRGVGQGPLWLLRCAAPGILAGTAMVPAVLAVQWALDGAPHLVRLLLAAGVGATVFVGAGWLALGRRLPAALTSAGLGMEVPPRPDVASRRGRVPAPARTAR